MRLLLSEDLDHHLVAAGEQPLPSAKGAAQDATRSSGDAGSNGSGSGSGRGDVGGGDAKAKANSTSKVRGTFCRFSLVGSSLVSFCRLVLLDTVLSVSFLCLFACLLIYVFLYVRL